MIKYSAQGRYNSLNVVTLVPANKIYLAHRAHPFKPLIEQIRDLFRKV